MRIFLLISVIISATFFGQNTLPDLKLSNSVNLKSDEEVKDVYSLLKLKDNEIAVSFYTNGGLGYHLYIDNFIFKTDGNVSHYKDEIYFKRGKISKKKKIEISDLKQLELKQIIQSDFFKNFSKYTQDDFKYSANNHQICSGGYFDDAPENFVMITQNGKQTNIMVYLPKNNLKCSAEDSPLMKFVDLHKYFNVVLDR